MRRLLTAVVIALVIAGGIVAHQQMNVDVGICAQLDPDGWLYLWLGCGGGPGGGGGSGAGMD